MALDVSLGNIDLFEAGRLALAAGWVDDVGHEPGSTEPWVSRLVADFVIARGARTVLETGCFKGATSAWIYRALAQLGGGRFFYCDIEPDRQEATRNRLLALRRDGDGVTTLPLADVIAYLSQAGGAPRTWQGRPVVTVEPHFDVAFVDDDHTKAHVTKELTLLYPRMNPGGLILLHDVFGVCDLQTVVRQFGGYSIDLPRMGPAGGLGIIQVPGDRT